MRNGNWKFVSLVALSVPLLLTIFSVVALAGGETLKRAPMSAAYAKYLAKKKAGTWHLHLARGGHGMGRLPNRFDRSYLLTAARTERAAARAAATRNGETYKFTSPALSFMQRKGIVSTTLTTPPTSFDLRSLGRIGPVEDQGDAGSCWDFAALASLESTAPRTVAFSENDLLDSDGFDLGPNDGGDDYMSMAYLTRCIPKSETQYPYQYQWPWAPLADTSVANPAVRVNDVYTIPSDPIDIKNAIWATKSVRTSLRRDSSDSVRTSRRKGWLSSRASISGRDEGAPFRNTPEIVLPEGICRRRRSSAWAQDSPSVLFNSVFSPSRRMVWLSKGFCAFIVPSSIGAMRPRPPGVTGDEAKPRSASSLPDPRMK